MDLGVSPQNDQNDHFGCHPGIRGFGPYLALFEHIWPNMGQNGPKTGQILGTCSQVLKPPDFGQIHGFGGVTQNDHFGVSTPESGVLAPVSTYRGFTLF